MRPLALNPLFASARGLEGVGPRIETLLKRALRLPAQASEPRVIDLVWHLPTGVVARNLPSPRPSPARSRPSKCAC